MRGRDLVVEWVKHAPEAAETIGTGWSIDETCGSLARRELALVWARTSAGKTTTLCNLIWNRPEVPTVFVSLEMPARTITEWLLTMSGAIPVPARELRVVMANRNDPRHESTVAAIRQVWKRFPQVWIVESRAPDVEELYDLVDNIAATNDTPIQRVLIDHLGLMARARDYTGVATTAEHLRQFAQDTNRLVIAAQQTGRAGSNGAAFVRNDGHLPVTLSSGLYAGEHDADWILGLWRPDRDPNLTAQERAAVANLTKLSVVKNRIHGTLHLEGITLKYDPKTRKFTELTGGTT